MRELLNRSNEQWALVRRSDTANTKLAIFVHGFRGNYLATWGRIPELLVSNADGDADFRSWDYLFLGYSTSDVATYLDIAALICSAWRHAENGDPPHRVKYTKPTVVRCSKRFTV